MPGTERKMLHDFIYELFFLKRSGMHLIKQWLSGLRWREDGRNEETEVKRYKIADTEDEQV